MIGFASKEELPQLMALFSECFPGEEAFAGWFFQRIWQAQNTLVYRANGEIEAMLQLLPVTFVQGSRAFGGEYVYAVGTKTTARGKGYAAALLEAARIETLKRGKDALILIPAEPSLFDYYARFGYRAAFYLKETEVSARAQEGLCLAGPETFEELGAVYESCMAGRFHLKRDAAQFEIQAELFGAENLYLLKEEGKVTAYGFAEQLGQTWRVAEAIGQNAEALAAAIAAEKGQKTILMRTAASDEKKPFAMILPLKAEETAGQGLPPYVNLLYN